jgi:hypothetical protein
MIAGQAHIGAGASLFGAAGSLVFKAPEWRGHVIQESSDVLPAHYCDHCGALLLETTRRGLSTLQT